jgi:hypothetical protein
LNSRVVVRFITAFGAAFTLAFGIWALADPRSFYDQIATYPPYNTHLLHDIGAFQAGIGATLLFGLLRRDALGVVLAGTSVGAVLHAVAHIMDQDLGGKSTDPVLLSIFAAAILIATAIHFAQRQR